MLSFAPSQHSFTPDDILPRLQRVRRSGKKGWTARCPAHEDSRSSLSIGTGDGGRALLHCFAGCSCASVRDALGLAAPATAVYAPPPVRQTQPAAQPKPKPPASATVNTEITAVYPYRDERGATLYENVRAVATYADGTTGKTFWQRRPDGNGGYVPGLDDVRRVPYRLPELRAALLATADAAVYLVEGEKDADNLRSLGCTATSLKNWQEEFNQFLTPQCRVVILPDHDAPGVTQAGRAARLIAQRAGSVQMLDLYDGEPLPDKHGRDVSDWLNDGGDAAALAALTLTARPWRTSAESGGVDTAERRGQVSAFALAWTCFAKASGLYAAKYDAGRHFAEILMGLSDRHGPADAFKLSLGYVGALLPGRKDAATGEVKFTTLTARGRRAWGNFAEWHDTCGKVLVRVTPGRLQLDAASGAVQAVSAVFQSALTDCVGRVMELAKGRRGHRVKRFMKAAGEVWQDLPEETGEPPKAARQRPPLTPEEQQAAALAKIRKQLLAAQQIVEQTRYDNSQLPRFGEEVAEIAREIFLGTTVDEFALSPGEREEAALSALETQVEKLAELVEQISYGTDELPRVRSRVVAMVTRIFTGRAKTYRARAFTGSSDCYSSDKYRQCELRPTSKSSQKPVPTRLYGDASAIQSNPYRC